MFMSVCTQCHLYRHQATIRGASMPDPTLYHYKATVTHVADGDTVGLDVSCGFDLTIRQRCRLHGCNVFEHDDPGGPEAASYLAALLPAGLKVVVRSVSTDRYSGRFVGQLWLPDGRDVSAVLVAAGFAAPWNGRGAKPRAVWPRPAAVAALYPVPETNINSPEVGA